MAALGALMAAAMLLIPACREWCLRLDTDLGDAWLRATPGATVRDDLVFLGASMT